MCRAPVFSARHVPTCSCPAALSLQTSNPDVYAIGDVAAFPLKLTGVTTRQEHVTCCR